MDAPSDRQGDSYALAAGIATQHPHSIEIWRVLCPSRISRVDSIPCLESMDVEHRCR